MPPQPIDTFYLDRPTLEDTVLPSATDLPIGPPQRWEVADLFHAFVIDLLVDGCHSEHNKGPGITSGLPTGTPK